MTNNGETAAGDLEGAPMHQVLGLVTPRPEGMRSCNNTQTRWLRDWLTPELPEGWDLSEAAIQHLWGRYGFAIATHRVRQLTFRARINTVDDAVAETANQVHAALHTQAAGGDLHSLADAAEHQLVPDLGRPQTTYDTIVYSRAMFAVRAIARQAKDEAAARTGDDPTSGEISSVTSTTEHDYEHVEIASFLDALQLTPVQSHILNRMVFEGRLAAEIAAEEGRLESSVANIMDRIRLKFVELCRTDPEAGRTLLRALEPTARARYAPDLFGHDGQSTASAPADHVLPQRTHHRRRPGAQRDTAREGRAR